MSSYWLQVLHANRGAVIRLVAIAACAGGIVGWLLARLAYLRRAHSLKQEIARLRELRDRRLDAFTRLTPPDHAPGQAGSDRPSAEAR
jgi:membrane protein YqaA with SNARE-associated domain